MDKMTDAKAKLQTQTPTIIKLTLDVRLASRKAIYALAMLRAAEKR
jgi:hypothetical protein